MPRRLLVLATLTATFATPSASVRAEVVSPTPWQFKGIGSSQTLLRIVTLGGGCARPVTPVVTETATNVRVVARNVGPDPGPEVFCPANISFDTVFVPLAAPLAGRALLGAAPTGQGVARSGRPPRVVGLSPGDASTVLRGLGLEPRVVERRTAPGLRRVLAQSGLRLVISKPPP